MSLTAGTRLGPYEILAPLGAGGMGEVFRARDTRLDRDVAIKILPQSVANDAAALARFEREAKAVAALSHPNILAIHDVGTSDGTTYAVMELLEGESLRESLAQGPMPPRKALEIAREVALGLAAAHEKGIVHRDLKPENLFMTSDGRVKILDFGLARQISLPSAGDTHSPTLAQATEPGTVLGTVGYIAPEQLRGHPADARSDIFSFGAVLYEAFSGRRAFKGDTAIETMNAILKEDPPDLSVSGRAVAPAVERIVRHCLEKNPAERFQSARDLAFALGSLSLSSASGVTGVPASPARARFALPAPAAAAAVLALLAAGALGGWLLLARRASSTAPEVSFHRLTFRRGSLLSARFTPDGQTVVYSAAWEGVPAEIFTVRTDSVESRPLGLSKADVGAISSKGELAVLLKKDDFFRASRGTLARVPLNGGTPREVLEDVFSASWAPNGEDLAVVHRSASGQRQLEYPVGKALAEPQSLWDVKVSPGGNLVAVAYWDPQPESHWSIRLFDSKGDKRTPVSGLSAIAGLAWSPRGDEILYVGGSTPWQQALRAVSLNGHGRVLLPGGGAYTLDDVSSTGRILLDKSDSRAALVCLPRGEGREREVSWLDGSFVRDISPDGQFVLFTEGGDGRGPKQGAFLRRADGAPAVRLGDGDPWGLSEDGRWVLTVQRGRLTLLPTGAGAAKTISTDRVEPAWVELLPGGKGFLVAAPKTGGFEYSTVPPEGGKPRPIPTADFGRAGDAISPDGDRLLYVAKDQSIRFVPIAGGEARKVPGAPLEQEDFPVQWDADGRTLYVWHRGSLPAAVDKLDLTTGRRQPWKRLMPADPVGVISIHSVVISRDGGSYAYSYIRVTGSDLFVVDGLLK